jgi:photosystem II stability/assembly factor-like uncharacterized protein
MKLKLGIPVLALVCSATLFGQSQTAQLTLDPHERTGFPTSDTAYKSSYRPKPIEISPDMRVKDDARARREWMKERMGGPVTADMRDALLTEIGAVEARHPSMYDRGAVQPGAPGTWTNLGPVRSNWIENSVRLTKSDTGRVRTILAHPVNPDIVYLLTSGGGLWRTTNFLAPRPTWAPLSDSVSAAGGAVAFGADPNTVILGLGDPFDGGLGGFVVKSTNGGATWGAPVALGSATIVTDIKVDGNTVFVGTNSGLWRSDDGGANYVAAGPTSTPFGVSSQNHPAFTAWSVARTNGAWLAAYQVSAFYGGIYRSVDGVNWTAVMPFTGNPLTDVGRTTLGVAEPGDPIVYAYAAQLGDAGQKDLFRSTDGGQTWIALGLAKKAPLNPNDDQPDMNIMLGQAFYNQMVLVDPADATRNTVYIGGQLSSAKTTDGGQAWRLVSNWLAQYGLPYVHADFHAAAYMPQTKSLLFGTDGGLFVSTDSGATWSDRKNDGISSYLVYAMATNPKNSSDVIVGLQDNGTRLRVGNGNTFNQVFGGDGFGVGWGGDGVSLGSIYFSFLFRNPNGTPAAEQKWQVGWNGIADEEFYTKDPETGKLTWPNPQMTQFITNIYQPNRTAASAGRTFYHRTKYTLYRTTNSAGSWKAVGNFKLKPDFSQGEFRGVAHPIAVGFDNEQEIAVAMSGGQVMISTDGGQTVRIEQLNAPRIPGMASFATAVAWGHPNELYLSTENANPASPHLLRSKDAGLTWERLDGPGATQLPRVPVSRILVSPRDRNTVFVGTWIGVFVSKDRGATWAPLGNGLPLAMINDLWMPADGSLLRAASYGRGIWDYRF